MSEPLRPGWWWTYTRFPQPCSNCDRWIPKGNQLAYRHTKGEHTVLCVRCVEVAGLVPQMSKRAQQAQQLSLL
jgi:hypothetical protein